MSKTPTGDRRVALLTLGCARNEVDSEELAARLAAGGWRVSTDGADADVVLVNTCGFVASAKQDSIDTLLAAADTGAKVVATGCMAERYGKELADSLPEADAVLGFDHYPDIADRLSEVLEGQKIESHVPRDRRTLLPLTPVERRGTDVVVPGHLAVDEHTPAHLRGVLRRRLDGGPVASLKLASGCDRRCAFCAIPSFRGAFVSRTPDEILAEAEWLAGSGVRELVLVSENSTSYGKDLGDPRLLEKLLPQLAAVDGIVRVRASYLQPAETRPGLVEVIATTPGVAPYFDLSFQHASEPVLRRMRRFGSTERFLDLLASARALDSEIGARSNFIVGFPGETRDDVEELVRFLEAARLDAVGVFAYSDEDGTEAAGLPGKVRADTIRRRYQKVTDLVEQVCAQRADERVDSIVEVLVDTVEGDDVEGRAAHQAPEVDGSTTLVAGGLELSTLRPGDLVAARVTAASGVDLVAVPEKVLSPAGRP
ncbi:30S ribosomal protein S12 methylthiotransferase RimO [Planosporangium mesophilum]|uniref:Ribosomal protein uS12 methylthiotransferase RimO n=1 Tax=Planosporangium mesophilum TaxID=689768 RepID=A0A8J3T5D6_9ACTN|nr:30S ribosomal protein S12 methylthiotransferase RimO [Planosporangium mesophilum]NJC81760.1 30S ribosomal protein S12 methylthiotransferase RimO [Planosporangium mesophilum]GII20578.1 ribosomal protein S12 methylthiotransferase RimO [Planosporangium mesophilum]